MSKNNSKFEKALFTACGPDVVGSYRRNMDTWERSVALALFNIDMSNGGDRAQEKSNELLSAFCAEIDANIAAIKTQGKALEDARRLPGWRKKRIASSIEELRRWKFATTALDELTSTYAYLSWTWSYTLHPDQKQKVQLLPLDQILVGVLRQFADAYRSGQIGEAKKHAGHIQKLLVTDRKLITKAFFAEVIKFAAGKREDFPVLATEESKETAMGKALIEAGAATA